MHKKFTHSGLHIVFVWLLLISVSGSAQQQSLTKPSPFRVSVPGTVMHISIPAGFTALDDGSGYIHPGSASSIMINNIAGSPFEQVVQTMQKGQLENNGNTLIRSESVKTHAGKAAMIYYLTFTTRSKDGKQDVPFERIIFLTGDAVHTLWITANYPAAIKKYIESEIMECLLSVSTETE